ncbi:ABC-type organic anion transporter ABCA8-like [Gastrophryne carolinensis]
MDEDTLRNPSLFYQTLYLFWKNLLSKWRRKWHTLLEWLQNLAFIILMVTVASISDSPVIHTSIPSKAIGTLDGFNITNLTVGYVNTSPTIKDIMERVAKSSRIRGITVLEYHKEDDFLKDMDDYKIVGVVFDNHLKYHMRYPMHKVSSPNHHIVSQGSCFEVKNSSDPWYYCNPLSYWTSGFLLLQANIDSAIIEINTGKSIMDTLVSIQIVKMEASKHSLRLVWNTGMFVVGMCMCYTSLTYLLSLYVTRERQQMREIMKVMRLKDLAFWLSWGLFYTFYVVIIATLMTLVVKNFVYYESSFGVILLLFMLYGLAMISFTFLLSVLLRRPRVTAIAGFFITICMSASSILLLLKNVPKSLEVFLSVFPPFSFAVGLIHSIHLENDLQGAFFSDMAGDSSPVLSSCISLILDIVFYTILTLYVDKVLPDKHGMRHEPLFFAKASFWRREKRIPKQPQGSRQEDAEWGDHIEKVPNSLHGKEAIRVRKMKKTYKGQDKKVEALKGLDFDIYEGQITALLGHSGAGKTTLLNILGGMCKATSGSASVYGYDASDMNHLQEIHGRAGFCPQFDVKFDQLTVEENLKVFANIKGIPHGSVQREVQRVLSNLQLTDVRNLEAGTLSGGQRRKLTLGIAVLGDPKVLLLDEPTAGLDPCSRHQVWAILKERKDDRVTLLSTQFMDEADILADRKAVISGGLLKCVGSSLFLKTKWGIGYHLRMQVDPSCDPEIITSLIQQHVPNAKLSSRNEQELIFTLPFQSMDAFPDLFSHLEGHVGRDIVSFGVSMTTLDDVFLKLEGEAEIERGDYSVFGQEMTSEEEQVVLNSEMEESIQLMEDSGNATLSGLALWRQQVLAVARIRFLKLKRDMKSFRAILLLIFFIIVPLIIIVSIMKTLHTIHGWELRPDLYFLRTGDKEHKYYSHLLICNNTGSPAEDFIGAVAAQDIVIDVTEGPCDPGMTTHKGAIEVSGGREGYNYTIIGSPRALNIFPVLVNIISNAILKLSKSNDHIQIWSNPLIYPQLGTDADLGMLMMSLLATVYAAGLVPHFAMSSIEDTRMKARSQLQISGLFPSAYWVGQALVDIPFYWLLLFLIIGILFLINYGTVFSFWLSCLLIVEIIGFGAALVLFVYIIAFIFRSGKSHHDWWSFFFVIPPLFPLVVLETSPYVSESFNVILYTFFLPSSAFSMDLALILYVEDDHRRYPDEVSSFLEPALMVTLISYIHIVLFSGILWCLEWKYGTRSLKKDPLFRTSKRKITVKPNPEVEEDADEEVLAERNRVNLAKTTKHREEKPVIIVDRLRKEFRVKGGTFSCRRQRRVATKNISFCVQKGEVLGLLGPNGAGKTTTIFMLAGELKPSAGEVELCDVVSSNQMEESMAFLGYCCQDSPLWPKMTVREHMEIYAAVKGMKKEDGDLAIRRVSEALELKDHLDKPARKLSAGVCRKVCFAISMLGNPTIVLLDEPSTGLDPRGQQRLWRAIRAAFKKKERGAILTTHYMEEAEAVCDRVAIMVSGKLRCIGSIQQLKSKFGKGYLLEMKVKDSQHADTLHKEITRMFPQATRQDRFSSLLVYKIPMSDVRSLSQAFLQLEEAKHMHNIEEYSFSQATLEQVFLELVKQQEKDDFDVERSFQWRQLRSESI